METLEELKAIRDNAPEGSTHIEVGGYYIRSGDLFDFYFSRIHKDWVQLNISVTTRSLSDINRIIELMELNQNMHATVAGYLHGKDWAHWDEFNEGKFKL